MHPIRLIATFMVIMQILTIYPTSGQETIVFSSTSIDVKIEENLIGSNLIRVTVTNGPILPKDYFYQVNFDNNLSEKFGSDGVTVEFDSNLIAIGRTVGLKLIGPSNDVELATREVPTGIWTHVKHLYANWTIGANPPPDGRGFGQGAVIDSEILNLLIEQNITSPEELIILSENVFNLIFGSSIDFNNDNAVEILSDNWGLFNYTIGMRDHIRNAGNAATDQTSEISTSATTIVANFSNVVEEGDPGSVYSNLTASGTLFGNIYELVININQNLNQLNLATTISSLKNNITILTGFITQNYEEFRSLVFDFKSDINDFDITIAEDRSSSESTTTFSTSKTADSPVFFNIIFLSTIFMGLITNKIHKGKKKV